MSSSPNAAATLVNLCHSIDVGTESILNEHLAAMAAVVHERQQQMLKAVQNYRKQLSENPSEAEFYDLFALLLGRSGCDKIAVCIEADIFDQQTWNSWDRHTDAPVMPIRRHIMLGLLDTYLEHNLYNGIGRVSQSIARTDGDVLLLGDWRLPSIVQPSFVEWLPTERWRVADVVLPVHVDWYDRCGSNTKMIESPLYEPFASMFSDMLVADLLKPTRAGVHQSLLTRLQKHPGVGSKKAHQIIDWLRAAGCEFLK